MYLSIIIPTLNEEKYLPKLLESIKKQTFKDYEIIVADAGSKDKTVEIAKKYGCKIVKGGLPAQGRNNGAKHAQGELLLFLDADSILPTKFFLEKAIKEFNKRKLSVASCGFLPADKSVYLPYKAVVNYFRFIRFLMIALENIFPFGIGACIFAEKSFHNSIGGFAESLKLAEDNNYIKKAASRSKYGVLRSVYFSTSVRRFDKEKWVRPFMLYLLAAFLVLDEKKLRLFNKGIFEYRYGNYYDIIKEKGLSLNAKNITDKLTKKINYNKIKIKREISLIKNKIKKIIEKI
ncbi:putative glycosyltransferase EpsJ [bacterium HR34]|nr:putative glycosyltransferase EpsJ [bacterium HR34]